MKTVDYLESRDNVDQSRIGCVGCSFGGTMSMFLSAVNLRISVSCISGYLMAPGTCSFSGTCGSQALPGLLTLGDRAEVAGLICPRPLLIQIGEYDSVFPARHALKEYKRLQRIYRAAGQTDRLALDRFDGCHEIHVAPIIEWFNRWLIV
jgi:dienelactone hydrolase